MDTLRPQPPRDIPTQAHDVPPTCPGSAEAPETLLQGIYNILLLLLMVLFYLSIQYYAVLKEIILRRF